MGLKVRIWDGANKRMTMPLNPFVDFDTPIDDCWVEWGGVEVYTGDHIVMQFIGRLDEDGKEIYEKDIVEYTCILGDGHSERWRDEVFYDNFCCAFLFGRKNLYSPSEVSDIKVIGNIFENPELLKGAWVRKHRPIEKKSEPRKKESKFMEEWGNRETLIVKGDFGGIIGRIEYLAQLIDKQITEIEYRVALIERTYAIKEKK